MYDLSGGVSGIGSEIDGAQPTHQPTTTCSRCIAISHLRMACNHDTSRGGPYNNELRRVGIDVLQELAEVRRRAAACAHLHDNSQFVDLCVPVALHQHGHVLSQLV